MKRCLKCKEYSFESRPHTCRPQWLVYDPDCSDADDARVVFAHDAEDAAERFCEISDQSSAEYGYLNNSGCDLIIVVPGEGNKGAGGRFYVSAEAIPSYSASQIKIK